ncbi:DNA (cytosine-5)-methyltransferase 1 [Kribbella orskensis]|uniref:Cytosine-specific methyltransferase n=1 Tax=Kribbella orskensis TaxID=2512216 RepID=A0ABY2B9J5_9ACTN|nr:MULTISPECIES: DNA (cytosine-5-)-methyltransferase [Kribbella]TCN30084.1 DNA (cytosine-5)-methyltransferase 1 [Kribbella sp. VKM Ac-2500]TCO10257.1 DNA (cytosine-5)-methyltransferase 1 [Kribbella orskensis]
MDPLRVVEICAGAGGQALGLERAGFDHALAVELDPTAAETLKLNRPEWEVRVGDVADPDVWDPAKFVGVDLLAGGVPCPPFSIAGKQLGANDERDLFAWAVELCGVMRPRALLLENVRGLSAPRFSAYRQHVLDRLDELGYVADWRLLQASDFGVPQLRPRFVLVALSKDDAPYFSWPEAKPVGKTVGEELADLMASGGWRHASHWVTRANGIGPTLVGGSKKHGGADLGPTRAKRAWAELGVDAMGVADAPPPRMAPKNFNPKLTIEMVARLQGWHESSWTFAGRKTSKYRQIGNAFPPPVAEAVGRQIAGALRHHGEPRVLDDAVVHDPVYRLLRRSDDALTAAEIFSRIGGELTLDEIQLRIKHLTRDFDMYPESTDGENAFKLGNFRAFVGQDDHVRHEYLAQMRSKVS